MLPRAFTLLLMGFACAGCACGGAGGNADGDADADADIGEECSDQDGDGYGVGPTCDGPDCNDYVDTIHEQAQCDDWCETHDVAPGCACDSNEPEICYLGDAATLGIGECHAGITTCTDGVWGACDGQAVPVDETCNEKDDNCDGEVDEGVLSECGTCGECERDCAGPEKECEGWGEGIGPGVAETPEGWLTLDGSSIALHVIWPSSSGTGEIFKVNTETLDIDGAYWTGPNHSGGGAFGGGDSPSRSAVDDFGSVIISNRAFGIQGSITKIASDETLCVDANGNGRIDTSTAWDDKMDFTSSDDWDDECILWHSEVGNVNGTPRGVAIHQEIGLDGVLEELGWVGLYSEAKVVEFESATGELTGREAPTPGYTPYGAAIDRDGWVWLSGLLGALVGRFDTTDPDDSFETLAVPAGGMVYRVIVDENNAPWIAGSSVWRWSRDREEFDTVTLEGGGGGGFGVSVGNVASDGNGSVFVGTYAASEWVWRVTNDPDGADDLENYTIATPGVRTFGTAVDFDGHAWAFNYFDGNAAVIDLETEEVEVVLDDCDGANCLNTPYVRGDITGLQRRNALNPSGQWSTVVEGCVDGETNWTAVVIEALTPIGSNLAVAVRTADEIIDLAALPWTPIGIVPDDGNEFDLDVLLDAAGIQDLHYLEVQVILQSIDRATAPTLQEVDVQWGCPVIIG